MPRARLIERLRGADARLVLVAAGPGFGKSVLMCQWLAEAPGAVAWLALDSADDEPARFFTYLVAAIRRALPDACPTSAALLAAPAPPPIGTLIDTLIDELTALDQPLTLALDDYHAIADDTIQQALAHLIDRQPALLRLVVASRIDPPWPLARWRVRQWLAEIRAGDLRFTPEETQRFIARRFAVALDPGAAAALHERTEGWVAGLQLAGLSLEAAADPAALARTLRGTDRHVMDYLLDEALASQPPELLPLLLVSALPERFCAPLCDALLDELEQPGDAAAGLRYMERHHLFLVPLDNERAWFRYHHLFRDLLLHRLDTSRSAGELARLRRRAGAWCADQGLIDEAIGYLLAGDGADRAADLVEQQLHPLLDRRAATRVLAERLERLPAELQQRRAGLQVARAFLHSLRWEHHATATAIQRAADLLDADPRPDDQAQRSLRGDLAALDSMLAYWSGDGARAIAQGQRALELIPMGHQHARGMALGYYAGGLTLTGQREAGAHLLEAALAQTPTDHTATLLWLLRALVVHYFQASDLDRAVASLRHAAQLAGDTDTMSTPQMLGQISYERNELDQAARYFAALAEPRYRPYKYPLLDYAISLMHISVARGDMAQARAYFDQAHQIAATLSSRSYQQRIQTCAAWLAWLEGDQGAADQLAATADAGGLATSLEYWQIMPPRVVRLLVLIASGDPAQLEQAALLQHEALAAARREGFVARQVALLGLRALLEQARGVPAAALETLAEAARLAAPQRLIRSLADLGPDLAPLLEALARQGTAPEYARAVLAAIPPLARPTPGRRSPAAAQPSHASPASPLTAREHEVLRLLEQRLTDAEIAERLVIAPSTVKTHIGAILGKLAAGNRRAAVARARELGLLPAA
jgi:LuxR family maltose regulon positive regulatory protein